MRQKTVGGKRINLKKLFATVIIGFFLLIISVICIYNEVVNRKIKMATNTYSSQIAEKRIEDKKKKEEEEKRKKQILDHKYDKLNNKELEKIDNIYKHQDKKRVLLTFDDGPTAAVTPFILDLLKKEKIKANFFVLGSMVENYPDILKREYNEGHFIANHGYSHKYKEIYENADAVINEYNRTNTLIRTTLGNNKFNSMVFRFPGGSTGGYYNDLKWEAKQKLREQGIASLDWNALTNDSDGADTKEAILDSFYYTIQDKTSIVLLMHDSSDKILTYEALPDIIAYFKNNGYEFQTIFDVIERTEWKEFEK